MTGYLSRIQQSYSVAFADYVRRREAEGKKIVKMQTGDPDFATHPAIVAAAEKALNAGETKYCDSRGLLVLRKAIAEKLREENNIPADARDILVTHGAVHAIGMAIRALVSPGDECIILEPFWRSYEANIILSGGTPIIVKTNPANKFTLDAAQVLAHITPLTRLIIINSPNNPSGAVYDREELIKLGQGASSKGVYIISDEVYESIIFDKKIHYSIGSDTSIAEWVISVFSFSKTHAMTGWRIGYLWGRRHLIDEILKLSQFSVTSLSPASQLAALAALTHSDAKEYSAAMRAEYEERKNYIQNKIAGTWLETACTIPAGTFYVLIDTSEFLQTSLELAKEIVDDSAVAFTPGIAFGDGMDNYLRMCFATSKENINTAVDALIQVKKTRLIAVN